MRQFQLLKISTQIIRYIQMSNLIITLSHYPKCDFFPHAKVLGVTISVNVCWNTHEENIESKAIKRMYVQYQVKGAGSKQKNLKIYL